MHVNNGRSARNDADARKGTVSRMMVASRPSVSFDEIAAPVPEIMDGFYILVSQLISQLPNTLTQYCINVIRYTDNRTFHLKKLLRRQSVAIHNLRDRCCLLVKRETIGNCTDCKVFSISVFCDFLFIYVCNFERVANIKDILRTWKLYKVHTRPMKRICDSRLFANTRMDISIIIVLHCY
jgi:hypothetical protein